MTSFFTIELDAFSVNENDKMPISYVLAIICKLYPIRPYPNSVNNPCSQ